MTRAELEALYLSATGNRTPRGAQLWAAEVLRVDVRTVRRWCTGSTSPTRVQVARLRVHASIAARARRMREERARGRWAQLRALFTSLDVAAAAAAVTVEQEHQERLTRDPFRFPSWDAFVEHRRRRGLRTRAPERDRDPERDPYALPEWLRGR